MGMVGAVEEMAVLEVACARVLERATAHRNTVTQQQQGIFCVTNAPANEAKRTTHPRQ